MSIADLLQTVSVILAAVAVILGVDAWRKEYVGKRKIELAEDVLGLFYEARDAVSQIRNPFSFGGEGSTRTPAPGESPEEKKINDQAFIVFERYDKHKEVFNKLYAMRYRFMARFWSDSAKPFDELNKTVNEIFISARMLARLWRRQGGYFRNEAALEAHLDQIKKQEAIFWGMGEGDPIKPRVDAVILDIEARCQSIITEKPMLERARQWLVRLKTKVWRKGEGG